MATTTKSKRVDELAKMTLLTAEQCLKESQLSTENLRIYTDALTTKKAVDARGIDINDTNSRAIHNYNLAARSESYKALVMTNLTEKMVRHSKNGVYSAEKAKQILELQLAKLF